MASIPDLEVLFVVPKVYGDEDQSGMNLIGANNVKVAYKKIYYREKLKHLTK